MNHGLKCHPHPLAQQQAQYQMYSQQQQQYQTGGYQHLPGAPQAVSSTSHNLKELYEPVEPHIKPNIHSDFLTCSLGKIPRNASILGKARTPSD